MAQIGTPYLNDPTGRFTNAPDDQENDQRPTSNVQRWLLQPHRITQDLPRCFTRLT